MRFSFRQFWANLHYHDPLPGWAKLLTPLGWPYALAVGARLAAYRWGWRQPVRVGVPVISIGNLTTGGTGKTPVVIALTQALVNQSKWVLVLSRGYGAQKPQAYARATHPDFGDEAFVIQQACPQAVVIVGRARAANARRAIAEYQPDVILLDDGFQYLPLARSLNILLVDGERGFGNGHLLPLGPLREPLDEIRRADCVWITKQANPALAEALAGFGRPVETVPFIVSRMDSAQTQEPVDLARLSGQSVRLFSGIARPESFEASVRSAGIAFESHRRFGDHHNYSAVDIARIFAPGPDAWLTTEKDRVKVVSRLSAQQKAKLLILQTQPQLPESALNAIVERLNQPPEAPRKILVIRYRFIGDTVLTIPVLRDLRRAYPQAQIDLLAAPQSGEVLRHCPYLDRLIFFDTTRRHRYENDPNTPNQAPQRFWSYVTQLHAERYEMAFVLKRSMSSAALAFLAGIPQRIGFDTEARGWLLTRRVAYQRNRHEAECFLDLLRSAAIPVSTPTLEAWWTSADAQTAEALFAPIAERFAGRRHWVVHITSSNPEKQWPLDRMAQLVTWLVETHQGIVHLLGAAGDSQAHQALRGRLAEPVRPACIDHAGQTTLLQSQALLARMSGIVSVDAGMAHLAATVKLPGVILFGPSNAVKWRPLYDGLIIVTPPAGTAMADISLQQVQTACTTALML